LYDHAGNDFYQIGKIGGVGQAKDIAHTIKGYTRCRRTEKGVDALPDYKEPEKELQPNNEYPFIFGNFRVFEHEHSSTFSNYQLMKIRGTNPLWINTLDARKFGIAEDDKIKLKSPWGEVEMTLKPTWFIMQGVLGSAGGFGHIRGLEGDPRYPQFGGVYTPSNIMKSNTTENVGGTSLFKYIKTKVEKK